MTDIDHRYQIYRYGKKIHNVLLSGEKEQAGGHRAKYIK